MPAPVFKTRRGHRHQTRLRIMLPSMRHATACLTLTLFGTDGRGCRYQAQTQIEVEVRNVQNRPSVGLENIRRGARVCVKYAQYCPSVGFDVELLIEIETLVTCLCVMGQKRSVHAELPAASALSTASAALKVNVRANGRDKKRKKG